MFRLEKFRLKMFRLEMVRLKMFRLEILRLGSEMLRLEIVYCPNTGELSCLLVLNGWLEFKTHNIPFLAGEEADKHTKQALIAGELSSLKKYSLISYSSWYFEKVASTTTTAVKNVMPVLDYGLQNVVSFPDHLNHDRHRLSGLLNLVESCVRWTMYMYVVQSFIMLTPLSDFHRATSLMTVIFMKLNINCLHNVICDISNI